jgi:hypothetical protein
MSAPSTSGAAAAAASTSAAIATEIVIPNENILKHAARIAIEHDKPIMLDYWSDSLDGKAVIGVRENGEKMLVKSGEEYTSPIAKIYRSSETSIKNLYYRVCVNINF